MGPISRPQELYDTPENDREDAVNGYLFLMPSLPTMKKEIMNWWKNYPMTAQDVSEVWIQK
jgi:hypothetical protein